MASVSDEAPPTQNDETKSSLSEEEKPVVNGEMTSDAAAESTENDQKNIEPAEGENQPSTITPNESKEASQDSKLPSTTSDTQEEALTSAPSENVNKEYNDSKSQEQERPTEKSRSVNFAPIIEEYESPKPRSNNSNNAHSNYSSTSRTSRRPVDFIDTLVESYKLETSGNASPNKEEKKYVPKTNRSRLNPNWREHRTRRLMNKLEELSLWDREEELKASQAQALREQKWEQIQDRQRNHDLCLNLMRQRHESEMESAVLLDRGANLVNDENMSATIARAMNIASPANVLAYDLPTPPQSLKRRVKQEQDNPTDLKTPIGRYRQFETNMDNKVEKLNQKLKPDREIMHAYSPYRTSIPATAVPLFSETYSVLLSVPDTYSTNKYNQYHYGVASHLHQPSPDYEARLRSYSNRDVRVPLKEQANDYNYLDDENLNDNNRSNYIDYDHYTKYRSNPIENDSYTKYRSNPIENDSYTKYRSNPIENDSYTKYRSASIEPDYQSRYRSNPIDDDLYNKYRSNANDDDLYSKYRSNPSEDDYYTKYRSTVSSTLDYSPPRRTTSMASPTASALYDCTTVANTPRDFSFIHSRPPASTNIHLRSLNDDLNAITRFSTEKSRKILQNINESPNDLLSSKTRTTASSSSTAKKNISYPDDDFDDENYTSRNYSSKSTYQPVEILSLSSTR